MTTPIPTLADWAASPADALAASLGIANQTSNDGASSAASIALGIAAEVVQALLPLAGAAVGGPWGEVVGAAVSTLATTLTSQHATSLAALTPAQQALVTLTIQTAMAQLRPVVAKKAAP